MKAGFTFLFNEQSDIWVAQALMDYLIQSFETRPKVNVMMGNDFVGAADSLDENALAAIPKKTTLKLVAEMGEADGHAFIAQVQAMHSQVNSKRSVFDLVVEPSPVK